MVGAVNQATGSFKTGWLYLEVFFVVGAVIFLFFDPSLADQQKEVYEQKEREAEGAVEDSVKQKKLPELTQVENSSGIVSS